LNSAWRRFASADWSVAIREFFVRRDRIIEFLLADRLLVGERLEPRGFAPRLVLAARSRAICAFAGEGDLVGDGVDLKEGLLDARSLPSL